MMNSVAAPGGRCERHTGPPGGSLAPSLARRIRAVTDVHAEDVASGSRSGAEGAIVFAEWRLHQLKVRKLLTDGR